MNSTRSLQTAPFRVIAPSRLHFGLLSFGNSKVRTFGGAGIMIDRPGSELRFSAADRFRATGPLSDRVEAFAAHWSEARSRGHLPPCHVTVVRAAPQHVGLGTGTQLALSVAYGLERFTGGPEIPAAAQLARRVGRGLRSAVGTYGFERGGFVAERGKVSGELLAPLDCQLSVPPQWRFVLLRPRTDVGLSGATEQAAFSSLPPVPNEVTRQLRVEISQSMRPALESEDLDAFGESIYRYGQLSGNCFSALQGGPYASPRLAQWVECLRIAGVRGVGQSSWGPTVFAITGGELEAQQIVRHFRNDTRIDSESFEIVVSAPNDGGVRCVAP